MSDNLRTKFWCLQFFPKSNEIIERISSLASKMEQINAEGQWRLQIEQLKMQGLNIQEQEKSRARAYQTDKNADAKIVVGEISANKNKE